MEIETKEEFAELVNSITADPAYPGDPAAFALGIATVYKGDLLDVRFPHTNVGENFGSAAVFRRALQLSESASGLEIDEGWDYLDGAFDAFRGDGKVHDNIWALDELAETFGWIPPQGEHYTYAIVLAWTQDFDAPPANRADAWLRLTLLSETKRRPNSINLDGIFGLLPNLLWTDAGPLVPESAWDVTRRGFATVHGLDKFPPMLDYVTPRGVRIADASRVRLGAHLAEGTTVMHEGFVNFNAGTLGKSMVEGRISAGVVVGDGSDIGGGASIMGTLSGGGTKRITVGEGCLLGANSGIGISLGNNCVVEAGLYVTAGTLVTYRQAREAAVVVKARDLSGMNDLLLRRNSQTGEVEALNILDHIAVELNESLHKND